MQKERKLQNYLLENPNRLKDGYLKLAERFGLTYDEAKEAASVLNKTVTIKRPKKVFPKKIKETDLKPFLNGDKKNVLIIGDTHIPFERQGYLEHCRNIQEQYNCGTVVHIGDVVDNNYSSYHETDPDGKSAGDELGLAIGRLKDWYKVFPKVKVCLGNHDQIIQRKAFSSGLSKRWIKGLNEVLEVPNWDFDLEYEINDVVYTHGTGNSGETAAYKRALNRRKSIVSGHLHTTANINWNVSDVDKIFAMNVGCGIDDKQYCFNYAKNFTKKSIVSCAVVLNNGKLPIIIPMEL